MTASECLRVAIGSSSCLFCQGNAQFIFVSMILIYFAVTHSHARRCSVHHCWSGRVESLLFDHVCVCVALKLLSFGRFTCGFGFGCLHRIFAKSNSNIHSSDIECLCHVPNPNAYNVLRCYTMSSPLSEPEHRADEWTNFVELIYLIEII